MMLAYTLKSLRFPSAFVAMLFVCQAAFGESWTTISSGSTTNFRAVTMVTPKVAFIAGDNGLLSETKDGGNTWKLQRFATGFPKKLYSVACSDTNTFAMAVGDNGEALQLLPNNPAWIGLPQVTDTLYSICTRPDSVPTFVSVGTNGYIAQYQTHYSKFQVMWTNYTYHDTTSFSTNVITFPVQTVATLRSVIFSLADGYIVGDSGIVITTKNSGRTWDKRKLDPSITLLSVAKIDNDKYFAVGLRGEMWMTVNGGTTWTRVTPSGLHDDLYSVTFIDNAHGAAVGDNGLIIQTSDAGLTWHRFGVNTFANLRGVFAMTTSEGPNWLAVGENGVIVQTLYGGGPVSYSTDKNTIALGEIPLGSKKSDNFTISNLSATGYVTANVVTPDSRVVLSPAQLIVEAQLTGQVKVTFTPTDTGSFDIKLALHSDTSWVVDTIHVTAHVTATYATFSTDSVVFDTTARGGQNASVSVHNGGNAQLTLAVVSVSDTNFLVSCDPTALPGAAANISITLKHTAKSDLSAFAVMRTNDYYQKLDTIQFIAKKVVIVSVREAVIPSSISGAVYPNPMPVGSAGSIHISGAAPATYVLRVFDERGVTMQQTSVNVIGDETEIPWSATGVRSGAYFFELTSASGMKWTGRVAVQ